MNGASPRTDRVQQMLRSANAPKAVTSVSLDRRASVEAGSSSRPAPLTEIRDNAANAPTLYSAGSHLPPVAPHPVAAVVAARAPSHTHFSGKSGAQAGGPPGDPTRDPRTRRHSFRRPREDRSAPGLGQLRRRCTRRCMDTDQASPPWLRGWLHAVGPAECLRLPA
jgi:hypothetical protein